LEDSTRKNTDGYVTGVRKSTVLLLGVAAVAGCVSKPLGPYAAPAVVGQVFAADTRQPLAGVKVTRGRPYWRSKAGPEPKGAELLMAKPEVRTDRDGRFALASERVLTLWRVAGWNAVRLAFERAGYRRFQTNYSITTLGATNSLEGETLLDAGRIFLQPARQ
jgi:hypothetical protein